MPQILEWFLAGLLVFFGMLGTETTVTPPAGVGAPPAAVEATVVPDEVALLDLLQYVPDTPENRRWLTLGDAQAWHDTTGIPRVSSLEETRGWSEEDWEAWSMALHSQTMPPPALGIQYLASDNLRALIGFSYYEALQYADVGAPPDNIAIVTVDVPRAQVVATLEASGYVASALNGATLYSKGDDYAIDLTNPSRTAGLGSLNRVAVLDAPEDADTTTVLIARATAPIRQALSMTSGASLAQDGFYSALAQHLAALDTIPGNLVGIMFVGEMPVGDPSLLLGQSAEEARGQIEAQMAWLESHPLSPWLVTAYTTHRDGDNTYLSLHVALAPGADAAANADSLATRLAEYESIVSRRPFAEYWELYSTDSYEVDGYPIAQVTLEVKSDATNNFNWARIVVQRDDAFLIPAGQP